MITLNANIGKSFYVLKSQITSKQSCRSGASNASGFPMECSINIKLASAHVVDSSNGEGERGRMREIK